MVQTPQLAALPKRNVPAALEPLLAVLSIRKGFESQVASLLGDVWVAPTLEDALSVRRAGAQGACRIATQDGCVLWPSGKVSLSRRSEADRLNSALARRRALDDAAAQERECSAALEEAQAADAAAEEDLRAAQAESLACTEACATLKGQAASARQVADQAQAALSELEDEHERLIREHRENQESLEKAQPDTDALELALTQAAADLSENETQASALQEKLEPLQRHIAQLSERVGGARTEAARTSERAVYTQRMAASREQEIAAAARQDDVSQRRIAVARGADARAEGLLVTLASLADCAKMLSLRLEEESRSEQERSRGLHGKIAAATQASRAARERYEGAASRLSDVRMVKVRLEVQVEAAITVITQDCGVSLETALAAEPLASRAEAQEQAGALERRIKSMGAINPDAARDFDEVSERFAYLSSQLEDMQQARSALARIVEVIDERMREDFVNTFNQVNENFSQIFATLFPGGVARLSLVDADDIENTGVDVNAQPIGKRLKKMSLLSGGEKSMTAMALLFAVYRTRQTPFYILDEVEAALDDTNLRRLLAYLDGIRQTTQFIMITHQRRTMESADVLYGVSMQADGITKVISQKLGSK